MPKMNTISRWLSSVKAALAPSPKVGLGEIAFVIYPHILQRGDRYYLRYQIRPDPGGHPPFRMVPQSKKTREKAYYFFGTPISLPERGSIVERPLEPWLVEFAREQAIYWQNPDGSEVRLEIITEALHDNA